MKLPGGRKIFDDLVSVDTGSVFALSQIPAIVVVVTLFPIWFRE